LKESLLSAGVAPADLDSLPCLLFIASAGFSKEMELHPDPIVETHDFCHIRTCILVVDPTLKAAGSKHTFKLLK